MDMDTYHLLNHTVVLISIVVFAIEELHIGMKHSRQKKDEREEHTAANPCTRTTGEKGEDATGIHQCLSNSRWYTLLSSSLHALSRFSFGFVFGWVLVFGGILIFILHLLKRFGEEQNWRARAFSNLKWPSSSSSVKGQVNDHLVAACWGDENDGCRHR